MAFEFKLFSVILIVLLSLSATFCQLESFPVTQTIVRNFYKDTNIILKYRCDGGMRNIEVKSVTLDCEPQKNETFIKPKNCHPGQYIFSSTFRISCTNTTKGAILTTNNKFTKCGEVDPPKTTKTSKSKRQAPLPPSDNLLPPDDDSDFIPPPSSFSPPPITSTKTPPVLNLTTTPTATDNGDDGDNGDDKEGEVVSTTVKIEQKEYTMTAPAESVYLIYVVSGYDNENETLSLDYHSPHGYLAPADWPLLIFYQLSLSLYVFFLAAWLVLCCVYRKDLLQVQYYIGFVILLGLIEKIIFVTEYESLNRTGIKNNYGAEVFGELVSACKRTAARILVVVVSVGFGIVIPRLGKTLYYLLAIALIYFPFASLDGVYTRKQSAVMRRGWMLVVLIVLEVVDTFICYWIFSGLIHVMRKLRLRRNTVKLSIYRHFTNTLIFTMLAAVLYMVWFVITFQRPECNSHWRVRWLDLAFWPFLFQLILLLIIILWRPSPTNNRYAYSPLTDEMEDDESQEPMINDAYGVKNRSKAEYAPSKQETVEETLKWVEDNIPKAADSVIPKMLDSDEEIENTLFEINKMQ